MSAADTFIGSDAESLRPVVSLTMVAPDLATANAETYGSAMLDSFKIDISHQEMERIIIELELIYKTQPGQWLPTTVSEISEARGAVVVVP